MVRAVVLVSLASCGRVGFGDRAPLDGTLADARPSDVTADVMADAAMLGPCTPLAFSDDFNDGTTSSSWTVLANNPVTTAETGGQLEVTLSTAGGAHYGGYDSMAVWSLNDHCMTRSSTPVRSSRSAAVTYDPVQHKVLRLREDNGTTSWETSADGTTFTVLASQPDPLDVTGIQVILESGTFASAPAPGIARYDNFDTP